MNLAKELTMLSNEMRYLSRKMAISSNAEIVRHSHELNGAADIALGWAVGIEEAECKETNCEQKS